MIVIVAS